MRFVRSLLVERNLRGGLSRLTTGVFLVANGQGCVCNRLWLKLFCVCCASVYVTM
jgi:hypothetical protein